MNEKKETYEIISFEIDKSKSKDKDLICLSPEDIRYNPIFNYKLKRKNIKYFKDEEYKHYYENPHNPKSWKVYIRAPGMSHKLYLNMYINNYVNCGGEIPEHLLNRSCLICMNEIPKENDHFYFSYCFHPVCVDCYFKLPECYDYLYGKYRKCPLCKRELRNWTDSQNIFTKKYLKPIKYNNKKLIFLQDNDLKLYYKIYDVYIKCYIDNKTGEYKKEEEMFSLLKK